MGERTGNPVTPQEMFDKVWDYFVVQKNAPGVGAMGGCDYRSETGARCAIGCLLPDEVIEDMSGGHLMHCYIEEALRRQRSPKLNAFFTDCDLEFLSALQGAHDRATVIEGKINPDFHAMMEINLRKFATDYALQVPPPENGHVV